MFGGELINRGQDSQYHRVEHHSHYTTTKFEGWKSVRTAQIDGFKKIKTFKFINLLFLQSLFFNRL